MTSLEETQQAILIAFKKAKVECSAIDDGASAFAAFCKGWGAGYKLGSEETAEMIIKETEEALAKTIAKLTESKS